MNVKPRIRDFTSAHPALATITALAALAVLLTDWKSFVFLGSVILAVAGLVLCGKLANDARDGRRQANAATATRADDQHEALLRGDDQWGVFGLRFPGGSVVTPPVGPVGAHRETLIAGIVGVAGLLVLAVTATVNARSADRAPQARPVSAPAVTVTVPASRPVPKSMNPTPAQGIPVPPVPAPPARLAAPVRMGQPAVDGPITFVVTSVDRHKTVANPSFPFMQSTANGTFLTAELTITNNGSQLEEFIASYQKLRITDAVYVPDPAAAVWTLTFGTFVSPGTTATATLSFDVPTGTPPGGMLELHGSSRSPGATVELLQPQ